MLRRLRRLKMSLATKCQLLFGIAAGIIILAALVVTWQRIEQLTGQQDMVAAETLAKRTLAAHVASGQLPSPGQPTAEEFDGMTVRRPRIVGLGRPEELTPFEVLAFDRFEGDPGRTHVARGFETEDGRVGYRLALPLRLDAARCGACHTAEGLTPAALELAQRSPRLPLSPLATQPAAELWTRPAPTGVLAEDADEEESDGEATADAAAEPLLGLVSVEIPSQIRTRQLLLNRVFLITASLAAAATATVTLYFILTRLILHPVRVLQETAEKVQAGDLNVRSDIPSGDEFQTLSETFNAMLGVVQERNEQLRRANVSLDHKLDQLAQTNVALDESNRLKSEFLANVSHELRTPLNSILGFADLVKDAGKENAKIQRYANNIHASGESLLDLINDLLDLAKIEAGRMELRVDAMSLADVFEAMVTLLGPLAQKRVVLIEPQIVPHVPVITTDAGKLQQILYNLLSNAIKFSPPGGRIELVAQREDAEHVRISVRDEGPGVATEDQERIFEKFRQLDSGVTRQHTGTGLGLAISRDLAALLGGRLGVDSVPGKGATFWLIIPIAMPAETPEGARRVKAGG